MVPFTNVQITSLWAKNEHWQRSCNNFLRKISNKYPKNKSFHVIKRTTWILPHVIKGKPVSGVPTFDMMKVHQERQVLRKESKVFHSPYASVQNSELYAILTVLLDISEPYNAVTHSQYAEISFT